MPWRSKPCPGGLNHALELHICVYMCIYAYTGWHGWRAGLKPNMARLGCKGLGFRVILYTRHTS